MGFSTVGGGVRKVGFKSGCGVELTFTCLVWNSADYFFRSCSCI